MDQSSLQSQDLSVSEDVWALLSDIEHYCLINKLAESTFGRRAVNDGKLCQRLREGKGITLKTIKKIRSFMHPMGQGIGSVTTPEVNAGEDPRSLPHLRDRSASLHLEDDRFGFTITVRNTWGLLTPRMRSGRSQRERLMSSLIFSPPLRPSEYSMPA